MTYSYFVSSTAKYKGRPVVLNSKLEFSKKIKTWYDILEVKRLIAEKQGCEEVMINSYNLLGRRWF